MSAKWEKRTIQAGASLYVNLPPDFLESLNLEKGSEVCIILNDDHMELVAVDKFPEVLGRTVSSDKPTGKIRKT